MALGKVVAQLVEDTGDTMSEHVKTRNRLKSIPKISTLMDLLNSCTLSEEDKTIVKMHYVQGKNLGYIADILGYSESTIKKKHKKILCKISKIL